jgi:nicotinate phosphoribosyltransferase
VRIDSGEVAPLARAVRKILDDAGLPDTQIFLSGDLDEYRIKALLDDDVPVDAFGVGTQLGTSADAPALGGVYKLVADEKGPKIKLSTGKATLPGCKQVHRIERSGVFEHDVIALEDEGAEGRPLLRRVISGGERVGPPEPLDDLRDRCRESLSKLPPALHALERKEHYPVEISDELKRLIRQMREQSR